MASGTGPGTVGDNIVQAALNFSPGGRCVTVAAELARGTKGEITGADLDGMRMGIVDCIKTGGMTGRAIARGRLSDRNAEQAAGGGVVTAGAIVMGISCCADQGVVVTTGTAAGSDSDNPTVVGGNRVENRPGAGMTGGTVTTAGEVLTNR